MAATYTCFLDGEPLHVQRKFMRNILNFVERIPKNPALGRHNPALRLTHLPCSAAELEMFPHMRDDFERAAQVCDVPRLRLKIPGHPNLKDIAALRAYALAESTRGGQARKFDDVSRSLTGLNHSPLVEKLRARVVARFLEAFEQVFLVHPHEPTAPRYRFGLNIYAEPPVVSAMKGLAREGHAYALFISGLLACSMDAPVSVYAAQCLLKAHDQGVPMALPALAERFFAQNYFSEALQCAILAVAGDVLDANDIVMDVRRRTANVLVETSEGMLPYFNVLVEHVMEPEVRELLFKQRPDWRPKTPDQVLAELMARMRGGRDE